MRSSARTGVVLASLVLGLTCVLSLSERGAEAAAAESDSAGKAGAGHLLSADPPRELLRRPLRVPRRSDGACPRTQGRPASEHSSQFGFALALGRGPVYPVPDSIPPYDPSSSGYDGAVRFGTSLPIGRWYAVKILWIAPREYRGWVVVRGKRLDGRHPLRFQQGAGPLDPHQWLEASDEVGEGWRFWSSLVRLRAAGCYVLQIDGARFSRLVVVKAAR